jgi:hypothetical protein
MARNAKTTRPKVRHAAYGQVFDRLDAALAKNSRSNDIEQIQFLRLRVFGSAPGPVELPK